ncbi:SDR family NAD(P)-dependent oxidoreductase, partial [Mycobacterium timonense]|uniref:SDR family NAD(P)-dependent oxidoreductase n=1 Tax=Mycobacterium timonense TaxID=701043 RepID=UPI00115404AA
MCAAVPPAFDLAGKVALVTGGSRGLGRSIAGALAAAGAEIVIVSRKQESCEIAAKQIAEQAGVRTKPPASQVS